MTFGFGLHINISTFKLSGCTLKHNPLKNSICYDFHNFFHCQKSEMKISPYISPLNLLFAPFGSSKSPLFFFSFISLLLAPNILPCFMFHFSFLHIYFSSTSFGRGIKFATSGMSPWDVDYFELKTIKAHKKLKKKLWSSP